MKKPKIVMNIIKEETGYSATANMKDLFVGTQGENMEELKVNILEAVNLALRTKE